MCDDIGQADRLVLGRRKLLGAASLSTVAFLSGCTSGTPGGTTATEDTTKAKAKPVPTTGTHVVTLGTAAGPAVRSPRRGISTAVVVDGHVYLVDCGLGAVRQAADAGLDMSKLSGIFITHLHSDHISELPGVLLYNWGPPVDGFTEPFPVIGAGSAGELPERAIAETNPPTPGTKDLVDHLIAGYAYDINIRVFDEARPPLGDLVRPADIRLPDTVVANARSNRAPDMEPFPIYEDQRVRVLAALNDHPPVYPSYGFRFETPNGVVALSGDTAESSNVVKLSRDADVLVHEAVFLDYYRGRGLSDTFVNHLAESHTDPAGVGRIASRANAKQVVMSHLAGVATDEEWSAEAKANYAGPVTVAKDNQIFSIA